MKVLFLLALVTLACSEGNVRLINREGQTSNVEGRVQVMVGGNWGEVCADHFGQTDAGVVCKELGHEGSGKVESGNFGIGEEGIVIGNVNCNGDESSILSCSYDRVTSCSTSIAAVDCTASLGATGSIGIEAGIIAAIVICLVAIVGVVILFGACLWRNDICCGGRAVA